MKLCWNCEGNVTFQDENCPYCGVYLSPSSEDQQEVKEDSLFSPPYRLNSTHNDSQPIPTSPYTGKHTEPEHEPVEYQVKLEEKPYVEQDLQASLLPLALLSAGITFILFSVALFLFSHKGLLTLEWNGNYWFFYLLISLPMLFFGWRTLNHQEE